MPRNTQNVYQLPPNSFGASGAVISSVRYNTVLSDLVVELNTARPISVGGTGANTAAQARQNLSVPSSEDFEALTGANSPFLALSGGSLTGGLIGTVAQFKSTNDVTLASTDSPFQLGLPDGFNLVAGVSEIQARNNGAAAPLDLNPNGGDVRANNSLIFHEGNFSPDDKLDISGGELTGDLSIARIGSPNLSILSNNNSNATAGVLFRGARTAAGGIVGRLTFDNNLAGGVQRVAVLDVLANGLFNVSTGSLAVDGVPVLLQGGSVASAERLTTARTIQFGGAVSGSYTFDGSTNRTVNLTLNASIGDISGLQTALNDKQDNLDADQIRSTTISQAAPSGGTDGDIWLRY